MRVDEIIAALPQLSPEDRGRLVQAVRALPGGHSTPPGPKEAPAGLNTRGKAPGKGPEGDIDLCLRAISEMLRKRGLEFASPYVLRKHPGFVAFTEKVPPVMRLLRKTTINRVELSYILELASGLLHDDLTHMGFNAVSSRLIMNHFHRIPSVINKSFPGYLSAGLLGYIIKRSTKRK